MTMPKREVNSVWSKVREDRDIVDRMLNHTCYPTNEDDSCSDRCRVWQFSGRLMGRNETPQDLSGLCGVFVRSDCYAGNA